MTDLRKEQLMLWRFEKQLLALAGTVAAGAATVNAVDGKLGGEAIAGLEKVQGALLQLAHATSEAHAALNVRALEAGHTLWQVSGGFPKSDPVKAVASILGIG